MHSAIHIYLAEKGLFIGIMQRESIMRTYVNEGNNA